MNKKIWMIVLIIGAILLGGALYWRSNQSDTAEAEPQMRAVEVERRTIENLVTATGTLEPSQEVEIGFTVSGIVSDVNFEVGDYVETGDVLAELDPSEYESRLALDLANQKALDADMRDAQNSLASAQKELTRTKRLSASNAASQAALDAADLAVKAAGIRTEKIQVEIEKNQLTIESDRNIIASLKLIAPFEGVVTAQPFQIGQSVSANDNSKARVSNLTKLINRAQVAEADIPKISEGMHAYLTTLGQPDDKIDAVVVRIEPTPASEASLVLYNVLLDIDNAQLQLFDGMTTQVFFVMGRAEDALTVPLKAVTQKGPNSTVQIEGKGEPQEVQTGLRDRLYVEIKSGLEEGQKVLISEAAGGGGGGPFGRGRP